MNDEKRTKFIINELEAIYEDIDISINKLILSKRFLKNLVEIANGAEPDFKTLNEIVKKIK